MEGTCQFTDERKERFELTRALHVDNTRDVHATMDLDITVVHRSLFKQRNNFRAFSNMSRVKARVSCAYSELQHSVSRTS